jgi:hypothetical protein
MKTTTHNLAKILFGQVSIPHMTVRGDFKMILNIEKKVFVYYSLNIVHALTRHVRHSFHADRRFCNPVIVPIQNPCWENRTFIDLCT